MDFYLGPFVVFMIVIVCGAVKRREISSDCE